MCSSDLFVCNSREYKIGGFFYRVRRIEQSIKYLEHSDFWEAPSKFIKPGRLNKPGEQLLYISPDPGTSKKEVGIEETPSPFFGFVLSLTSVVRKSQVKSVPSRYGV